MRKIPDRIQIEYKALLDQKHVPPTKQGYYLEHIEKQTVAKKNRSYVKNWVHECSRKGTNEESDFLKHRIRSNDWSNMSREV